MKILWTGMAGILAIGVFAGIGKMVSHMRTWREDLGREKAPWERAMADFDPKS